MLLYLIRHAEAVELGSHGAARDFDRPLTPNGRDQARALAHAFVRLNLAVDAVVASPLVRAHQTAVELLTVWQPDGRAVTCDQLAPERLKPGKLSDFLAAVPGDRVAVVGHMPELGNYVEWLIGASEETVPLAKAAAACVSFKGDPAKAAGKLHWIVPPNWFM
ncbi:SixA phosphatase family protein [Frigoriglobus tundricola]|uniref:Phosphohistidine phosphatase, SixA n=1 Tax=Frigoriglobus tundricola TaxID=2774151 RepID=A0A6M5YU93_9BACT|nr:phosphoglycerate mutase family protein [Frigoriglobus tundricola]QJW97657.1 phosphohistidine phosphatase, SixA [Frigoriglobus tundricola]